MNAAVDAIKAKHRIREVILAGQSGGATSVGALLTLGRTDVRCAAATSGGYDVIGRGNYVYQTRHLGRPGCDTTLYCDAYHVIDFTGGVKPDPSRRIFIIGDPLDSATPFRFQKAFAEKLEQAGHSGRWWKGRRKGPGITAWLIWRLVRQDGAMPASRPRKSSRRSRQASTGRTTLAASVHSGVLIRSAPPDRRLRIP